MREGQCILLVTYCIIDTTKAETQLKTEPHYNRCASVFVCAPAQHSGQSRDLALNTAQLDHYNQHRPVREASQPVHKVFMNQPT